MKAGGRKLAQRVGVGGMIVTTFFQMKTQLLVEGLSYHQLF